MEEQVTNLKTNKDADKIIACALIRHLYNEGKISELVYRNIKKEIFENISIANKQHLW